MENVREVLQEFKGEILTAMAVYRQETKDDIDNFVGVLRQEIRAAKTELRQEFKKDIAEVVTSVAQILDNHILPQIDDHEVRLTRLETRTI